MLRGGSSPRRFPHPLAAVSVVVALGLLGAAACSDDGDDGATSTTTSAPTTTSASTGSTEPTTPTTASTAPAQPTGPTVFTAEARDAVNELKAAWEDGDEARARAIAPGEVVDALFPIPPDGFEVYGCDTGEFDTSTCSYRNRSTGVYITVSSARSEQGWQVASIFVDGA